MHPVWILWEHPSGISQGHTSFCFEMKQTVASNYNYSTALLYKFQTLSRGAQRGPKGPKGAREGILKVICL